VFWVLEGMDNLELGYTGLGDEFMDGKFFTS
jgi:hypothetical protein